MTLTLSSPVLSGLTVGLFLVWAGCTSSEPDPPKSIERITVHPTELFDVVAGPVVLADDLANPAAPLVVGDSVVVAEGGKGVIGVVREGRVEPLLTGIGADEYAGYRISAQGITVAPGGGTWVVTVAEGPGHIYLVDPRRLPGELEEVARKVELVGAVDDNPYETLIIEDLLVASGGTSKAYQGRWDSVDPSPLEPTVEVGTGIAGVAYHRASGQVYAAVTGSGQQDGAIARWDPRAVGPELEIVAEGFDNLVDVLFTPSGELLALEFGGFGQPGTGTLSVVDQETGERTPFLSGLESPSSASWGEGGRLLIAEFGASADADDGTLIEVVVSPAGR